ncbi:MAG: TldD/PmbA family protein [Leptospirales bacterium]
MKNSDIHKIQQIVKKYKKTSDYAAVLFLEQSGSMVRADTSRAEVSSIPRLSGVVVANVFNGLRVESSIDVNLPGPDIVEELFEKNAARAATLNDKIHGLTPYNISEDEMEENYEPVPYEDISIDEKVKTAQAQVKKIHELDSSVVSVRTLFRHTRNKELYISSGKILSQELSRFEAIFVAALKQKSKSGGSQATRIFDGYGLPGGWENSTPPDGLLQEMIEDGKKILGAPRLQPGYYDCIFDPSLSGILAHEAFGHGTEADTMMRNRAKGSGFLGKRVASDLVTICDSPSLEGTAAGYKFDHEGQPAERTCIIDNGILKDPMTDVTSASILKLKRTANGRRESYDHKAYTRMTNTFFSPGEDKLNDMIQSVEKGVLVSRATNGMEDPKGWGIQLEALVAREIKNGVLTDQYYSPVIVTGYVPEILQSVSMVSDDFHINGLGMCGKGHKEWVKVTDGGPFLKLRARLA